MALQTVWFQHLKPGEDQENFKKNVLSSQKVLDRLREICYNIIQEDEKVRVADYASPSWSHEQAHRNGKREALENLIKILTIDKDH